VPFHDPTIRAAIGVVVLVDVGAIVEVGAMVVVVVGDGWHAARTIAMDNTLKPARSFTSRLLARRRPQCGVQPPGAAPAYVVNPKAKAILPHRCIDRGGR
jgi:hypothetical protein